MTPPVPAPLVLEEEIDAIERWAVLAPGAPKGESHLDDLADLRIVFDKQLARMQPHEQREELRGSLTKDHLRTLARIGTHARGYAQRCADDGHMRAELSQIAIFVTRLHARLTQASFD